MKRLFAAVASAYPSSREMKRARGAGEEDGGAGRTRAVPVSSDDLVLGPKYNLQADWKSIGLIQSQGRYVLKSSIESKFFAVSLPSGQLLWESDDPVNGYDVIEILRAMIKLDQSIHVNTGTHGTADGKLETAGGNTMGFYLEDLESVRELEDKAKVSLHMVTSQSPPYLPPKANMVINGWCFSHRYGFADKVDFATGRIGEDKHVEGTCLSLPGRLRDIIKSMLGDEQGVEDAMEGYIETNCSDTDPELRETAGVTSGELLEAFMRSEQKQVLLLLGQAGAGKSTLAKKWAVETGDAWELGKRYPVFLHLPRCRSVREWMEDAAGVCFTSGRAWRDFVRGKMFLVVMDSFDEMGDKTNVVGEVLKELSGCEGVKAVVTCRSGYLKEEAKSNPLFWPGEGGRDEVVEVAWICRVSLTNKERVSGYIEYHVSKTMREGWNKRKYEEAMESMDELRDVVSTPYSLKMMLLALPRLQEEKTKRPDLTINRHSMYREYTIDWYRREWKKLQQSPELACRARQRGISDENYIDWYSAAAQQLCLQMYRKQKKLLVLKAGDVFLSSDPFNLSLLAGDVKQELGYWLLRGCLTRVKEIKQGGGLEVSFVHDLFRSFFLTEETLEQLRRQDDGATAVPESLTLLDLRGELESIKEHAMVVRGKAEYSKKLLDVVRASQLDRLEATGKASANAATILVAAGVSMSGLDLRG
eukprot:751182-Hanusia_phi.AAC.1